MSRGPVLIALALAVRLPVVLWGAHADLQRTLLVEPDAPRYLLLADNLVAGRGFAKAEEDGLVHQAVERARRANGTWVEGADGWHPEVFRTPVYPAFLAACGGWKVALVVQCLLGALAAAMAAGVAESLAGRRAGWFVGVLWSLHPGLAVFDCVPLTESLFGFLALLGLWLSARRAAFLPQWAAGLVIGLCGLTRPLGLVYLPTALLIAWPAATRKWLACVFLVGFAAVPSVVWAMRNQAEGNGFRVTTVGDINAYFYAANYVRSERAGDDWAKAWPGRVRDLGDELMQSAAPGEDVLTLARTKASAELRADPKATLKVAAKSQVKLFTDHSLRDWYELFGVEYKPSGVMSAILGGDGPKEFPASAWLALAWSGLNALTVLLALFGVVRAVRRREWRLLFATVLPIVLFSAASFPVGLERFRLPMMLFLFTLAGYAVVPPRRDVVL